MKPWLVMIETENVSVVIVVMDNTYEDAIKSAFSHMKQSKYANYGLVTDVDVSLCKRSSIVTSEFKEKKKNE